MNLLLYQDDYLPLNMNYNTEKYRSYKLILLPDKNGFYALKLFGGQIFIRFTP